MPHPDTRMTYIMALEATKRDAMKAIPESHPDRIEAIRKAVNKAHPNTKDVLGLHGDEVLTKMAGPVVLNEPPFLKPDAAWGLAVYRVSYSDDAAWDRMLFELRESIENSLVFRLAQPDICSRHELVVMDDQSKFEGAGLEKIREHFKSWAVDELRRNWRADREFPTKDEIIASACSTEIASAGSTDYLGRAGTRYNYCILVDDICLESLEKMSTPVLKLVSIFWTPYSEQEKIELEEDEDEEHEKLEWEGGETNNEFEDVGWVYFEPGDYVETQNMLQEDFWWPDMYIRPPLMRFVDEFSEAPGFWRRNASSA